MMQSKDQLGRILNVPQTPQRVISLVPSQSEFLWELGLGDRLVGITKFCRKPEQMFKQVTKTGGTKKIDFAKLVSLKPDLVIANKEENTREEILKVSEIFPVWISDVNTFDQAFEMMSELGLILELEEKASELVQQAKDSVEKSRSLFYPESLAYFIWNKPYHLAGSDNFIHHVIEHIGFKNAAADRKRYPEVSAETLKAMNPARCFLSSEPFPFEEKHVKELSVLLPDTKITRVDGEMFSWYGSRLIHLHNYLLKLKQQLYA
ncbi:MAG TPA: helical backbone metal receptor [Bacteroidia bacterium]|nr:helical backbone metal receptor [Bacteroidia bacterium]